MQTRLRHGIVATTVIALTLAAFFAQSIYGPGRALACSCIQPMPTLEQVAADPGTVVVAGTIGPQAAERTPVQVDSWFLGANPQPLIWLSFGKELMTSCDPVVTEGERRLLVLSRHDENLYGVNPCVAESGVIGTEAGDAALAAANRLWGEGAALPTPEPTPPPQIVDTPGLDTARLYIVGAVGAGVLVFAAVILLALLRRRST
jgi:hypothetical protein